MLWIVCLCCSVFIVQAAPAPLGGAWFAEPASWLLRDPWTPLGEPLNVIVSAQSDRYVLTLDGFVEYLAAIGLHGSCLGIDRDNNEQADLNDGLGWRHGGVVRYDYGAGALGSCFESLVGGNHARYWQQATTSAWFLAASVEEDVSTHHTIAPQGYDLGRDWLAGNATGTKSSGGRTFKTRVEVLRGLYSFSVEAINHDIAIDNEVLLLTVEVV